MHTFSADKVDYKIVIIASPIERALAIVPFIQREIFLEQTIQKYLNEQYFDKNKYLFNCSLISHSCAVKLSAFRAPIDVDQFIRSIIVLVHVVRSLENHNFVEENHLVISRRHGQQLLIMAEFGIID